MCARTPGGPPVQVTGLEHEIAVPFPAGKADAATLRTAFDATYAALLSRGYKFQPILCQRRDDGRLCVVDGHHRYAAYVLAGRLTISTFIH